jgi:ribonuclease R
MTSTAPCWPARNKRGAVDFETVETQIVCDESGRIEKIVPRTRNDAHKLIEEAMLAANVCSADFILQSKHPGLYRVHEGPTPEKKEILRSYLKATGVGLSISDDPTPGEFQAIAARPRSGPMRSRSIRCCCARCSRRSTRRPTAGISAWRSSLHPFHQPDPALSGPAGAPGDQGHPGQDALPVAGAAHAGRGPCQVVAPARKGRWPAGCRAGDKPRKLNAEGQAWEAAGLHCSANERRADEASRDVEAWLKCKYMREHLGEEYGGVVTAATSFGIFVTLDAMYVEGLVHITELGGEYFRFDEVRQELRGERTGIRYAIGTRVRVQVSRVDLDGRRIDFRLVREGDELLARAMKDKGAGPRRHPARGAARDDAASDGAGPRARRANARTRAAGAQVCRGVCPRDGRQVHREQTQLQDPALSRPHHHLRNPTGGPNR